MFFTLKDPNSVLDFTVEWDDWMASGDSISSSRWYVSGADSSLYVSASGYTSDTATVWLSGGTATQIYIVTNRITSVCNRVDDRSIRVIVREE